MTDLARVRRAQTQINRHTTALAEAYAERADAIQEARQNGAKWSELAATTGLTEAALYKAARGRP